MSDQQPRIERLALARIRRDGGTQVRPIDDANVERLAEVIRSGGAFTDRLRVWFDGKEHWLSHGFHRAAAYEQEGKSRVECDVLDGTVDDARDDACRPFNAEHGRPETAAERRERCKLYVARHMGDSLRMVAEWCGVGRSTVERIKEEIESTVPNGTVPGRIVGKDGREQPAHRQKPEPATVNELTVDQQPEQDADARSIAFPAEVYPDSDDGREDEPEVDREPASSVKFDLAAKQTVAEVRIRNVFADWPPIARKVIPQILGMLAKEDNSLW